MRDPVEALEDECLRHSEDARFYKRKLEEVLQAIRDEEDRYGIGNMGSQWTSSEIADDIIERLNIRTMIE